LDEWVISPEKGHRATSLFKTNRSAALLDFTTCGHKDERERQQVRETERERRQMGDKRAREQKAAESET
jgi:hypothetical protein